MARWRLTQRTTDAPDVSAFRAAARLLRLTLHLWRGLHTLRTRFSRLDDAGRQQAIRDWSRDTLRILGVHLQVLGEPPPTGPLLVVCNHISWLDIVVLNAARPCRFVSKADVKHWPLIGRLVEGSGTLFIERENRRDALRVVHHMAERLQAGDVLALFPEGTTGDGQGVLPFHANLLQAALAADSPVLPVGLVYLHGQGQARLGEAPRHAAPTYIGDTTLVASIWRTVNARDVQATVHWGLPDTAQGRDRRAWGQALRAEVARLADAPLFSPSN
jgi:1-acyl-sn-glycerol-3-phosphate acyltransferase